MESKNSSAGSREIDLAKNDALYARYCEYCESLRVAMLNITLVASSRRMISEQQVPSTKDDFFSQLESMADADRKEYLQRIEEGYEASRVRLKEYFRRKYGRAI